MKLFRILRKVSLENIKQLYRIVALWIVNHNDESVCATVYGTTFAILMGKVKEIKECQFI